MSLDLSKMKQLAQEQQKVAERPKERVHQH